MQQNVAAGAEHLPHPNVAEFVQHDAKEDQQDEDDAVARRPGGLAPQLRQKTYLTLDKLGKHARPDALIMHPGPVNRGIELAPEVADGPYSVILDQVARGVAVRMGVLLLLAGRKGAETA